MKRAIWLLGVLFCLPVFAEPALGRLFFTPTERAALDAARRPLAPTLNGVVKRDGQVRAVWVNGARVQAASAISAVPPATALRVRRHD